MSIKQKEGGWERHPSFGLVSISRCQSTGRHLFDSPFRHQHFITLSVKRARRQRSDLHDNFIMDDGEIVEVAMSEVQFAAMVTSLNMGVGTPCTITHLDGEILESVPPDRTKETFEKEGAEHFVEIAKLAEELETLTRMKASDVKAPQRERMAFLALKIRQGLTSSREFFNKQFQESMDKVVGAAKAEIQAHVAATIQRAGLKALKDGEAPFALEMDASHPVAKPQ